MLTDAPDTVPRVVPRRDRGGRRHRRSPAAAAGGDPSGPAAVPAGPAVGLHAAAGGDPRHRRRPRCGAHPPRSQAGIPVADAVPYTPPSPWHMLLIWLNK